MPRFRKLRRRNRGGANSNRDEHHPCRARHFGISLQLTISFLNAFVWGVSVLTVICGFVIGLGNDTIRIGSPKDFQFTTPATILIIYGVPLILVSTVGCFSAVAARVIISVTYVILIIGYVVFDMVVGYGFLINADSLEKFYASVNKSLAEYSAVDVGIFPAEGEKYWDHLQSRGRCCGLISYEDWRDTNYSRHSRSIPDSCCNEDYSYRYCGEQVFRHPDTEAHSIMDIVNVEGCMFIFPNILRLPQSKSLHVLTNMVGSFLIVCLILTLVILAMVLTRKFRPEEGITNLEYTASDPNIEQELQEEIESEVGSGEQVESPSMQYYGDVKVSPEPYPVYDYDDQDDSRRVLFRESGPNLIPSHHTSQMPSQQVVYLSYPPNSAADSVMMRNRPQTSYDVRSQNQPQQSRPYTSYQRSGPR